MRLISRASFEIDDYLRIMGILHRRSVTCHILFIFLFMDLCLIYSLKGTLLSLLTCSRFL